MAIYFVEESREAMQETGASSRFAVLDSYRALAALLVVFFHYFYRWGSHRAEVPLMPDLPWVSDNIVVAHGALGVEFFFMISGFVIALTLRSTSSLLDFAVKRFARLFPAMFVCSVTTYLAVSLLDVAPLSDVSAIDFLPSLTFISPAIYNKLLGVDSDWISGVYWSLFVEVKFYFFAALVYFIGPGRLLRNYAIFSVLACLGFWGAWLVGLERVTDLLPLVFYPKYAGFFLAGMAFQQMFRSGSSTDVEATVILAVSLVYTLLVYSPLDVVWTYDLVTTTIVFVFFGLFWLFVKGSPLVRVFEQPWLARIGAASYSLYLLHESIGVSAAHRLGDAFGESPVWTFLVMGAVIALSVVLYDHVETPARRVIRKLGERSLSQPQNA